MASQTYTDNDAFFNNLGFLPGVVAMVDKAATAIESKAVASAPVDSGDYRDEIHQEVHSSAHRYVKRVVAGNDKSMGVESRTGNLARAVRGTRVY